MRHSYRLRAPARLLCPSLSLLRVAAVRRQLPPRLGLRPGPRRPRFRHAGFACAPANRSFPAVKGALYLLAHALVACDNPARNCGHTRRPIAPAGAKDPATAPTPPVRWLVLGRTAPSVSRRRGALCSVLVLRWAPRAPTR